MDSRSAVAFARAVKDVFSEKKVTFLAGSIAYSAFVSIVPLLLFFFLAVSVAGAPDLQQRIVEIATDNVSPAVGGVIEVMVEQQRDADGGSTVIASVIGALTLVWGVIKVFRGLDTAFSEIYETTARESFVGQLKKSLLMLVTLTLGVVAMVGAMTVVAFFAFLPLIEFVTPVVLLVGLVVAFVPMYYLFPDLVADVGLRDVLPVAVFGAVGWTVLQVLFQVYATVTDGGGNLIASILLLVTWLYFGSVILLLGAVINAVAIGQVGDLDDAPTD